MTIKSPCVKRYVVELVADERGLLEGLIRKGKTWRVDINPGDDVDLSQYAAMAVPFTPAPAPAK